MAKVGRKSLFTPKIQTALVDALRASNSNKDAAALAGIGESTFYQWLAIGAAYRDGKQHDHMPHAIADREVFLQFSQEVKKAQAVKRVVALSSLQRSSREKWLHRLTLTVRYSPPPPITWYNTDSGQVVFDDPVATDVPGDWERQWSGDAWLYYSGDWHASAWILERSDPENWARRSYAKIEGLDELQKLADRHGITLSQIIAAMIDELSDD